MVEYTKDKDDFTSLVTTALAIIVVVLLGIMGYAYYTKDITPKNKIVEFFSSNKLTFHDLSEEEKSKYVLKSSLTEMIETDINEENKIAQEVVEKIEEKNSSNEFLEKVENLKKNTNELGIENDNGFEAVQEENKSANRFLEKMAAMQKETDEMVIEGKSTPLVKKEESKPQNRFLEKMAKQQKKSDEIVIEGKSTSHSQKEENEPKNRFLEKMAKQQKKTDEMIIRGNSNNY